MDSDVPVDANGTGAAQPAPLPSLQPSAVSLASQEFPVFGIGWALAYMALHIFLRIGLGRMASILATAARLSPVYRDFLRMGAEFAAVAILFNFAIRRSTVSWRQALSLRRFSGWLLVPLIVAAAGFNILDSEATNGVVWLYFPPAWLMRLFAPHDHSIVTEFLAAVVVAPLVEEAFDRGLILRGMLRRYSVSTAIYISAGLFALSHLNPYQFPVALSLGLLAGWVFTRSGSLWPGIILHVLVNFVATFVRTGFFPWAIDGYSRHVRGNVLFQPLWFDALGIGLLIVGLLGLCYVFNGLLPRLDRSRRV